MTPFDVLESYIFREINPQTQTINKKKTVTLQLEEDGVWRVIGYFIE